jgi:formamidopyrimidine-DNA glycosylase
LPELPDVTVYVEALAQRVCGRRLERLSVRGPFLLRSVAPPVSAVEGRAVVDVRRVGKRVCIGVEGGLLLAIHLMIAGRLHWKDTAPKATDRRVLAVFAFDSGVLTLTEAGTQHRASLHVIEGEAGLHALDAGGIDVFAASPEEFAAMLRSENHTLKRALTDPRLFSGIGNAYSDEILHRARLSPGKLSQKLNAEERERLFAAARELLQEWIDRLDPAKDGRFPERVTAFRPEMAVHGKYKQPCPVCGSPVQRIQYADNDANYCATCQTGGRLLADRSLSRLLKGDWPRTLEELEERQSPGRPVKPPHMASEPPDD